MMSEQRCNCSKDMVLQFAAGMVWSPMTDERVRDNQKDEVLPSAVAASTDGSSMKMIAGQ